MDECNSSSRTAIHTKGKYVIAYAATFTTIVQMVRLYKDPRGETVFTAHEEALQVTSAIAQGCPFGDHAELSKLTKKIKQLEDNIEEYKVERERALLIR